MSFDGKILLVDDEPHIRKFVSLILQRLGNPQIIEASTADMAVSSYFEHRPDLVLLDINMPGRDGIYAVRDIMETDPDANIVMLTSLANRQNIEEALDAGALAYIRKDTPSAEILSTLQEVIQDILDSRT